MRRRLTDEERERIDTRFEDDVLYRLVADTARHGAGGRQAFRLSPEEVMVLVADLLDRLKEEPDEAHYRCQTAWDTLLYDVRTLAHDAPDDDVRGTAAMVLELAALLLSLTEPARHRTCTLALMCALQEHAATGWEEQIHPLAWRIGESRLKERMETYWQAETFLSDDIYEALHPEAGEERAEAKPKGTFKIAKGQKTNFAKIVSAMFDLRMFEDDKGQIASNKQKLMDELGALFGTEFKNLPQLLNASKQGASYTDVFDRLKEKAEKYDIK